MMMMMVIMVIMMVMMMMMMMMMMMLVMCGVFGAEQCSWLRRDSCVGVKSLSVPLCASPPATKHIKLPRPLQFKVFCPHIASHGALVLHFSGMNTAGWSHGTPNEDFGCVTSHAQSTVNTFDLVSDKVVACNQCGCTDTCSVCGV